MNIFKSTKYKIISYCHNYDIEIQNLWPQIYLMYDSFSGFKSILNKYISYNIIIHM